MAKVIETGQMPTLVMSHNKTLAAQLYHEFKDFSRTTPSNTSSATTTTTSRRPTSPRQDLYIEKDSIDQRGDRPAPAARPRPALASREDVIVVATVSCHLRPGLAAVSYLAMARRSCRRARRLDLDELQATLVDAAVRAQRRRAGARHLPGARRNTGDPGPPTWREGFRIETDFGDEVERLRRFNALTGEDPRGARRAIASFPPSTSSLREDEVERQRRPHPRGDGRAGRDASSPWASSWRPSASSSAPSTTSRCWRKSATARASRTTRATSRAASRATARPLLHRLLSRTTS